MKYAKLISLLLAIALLTLVFAACDTGDPAMKAAAGTYRGEYTKIVGDEDSARNYDEAFTLTLKEDGTGVHARDDMEFKITWTLEGETFTMKETFIGDPIQYTGTLKEGVLDIFNGDPGNIWTYEYVYSKQ